MYFVRVRLYFGVTFLFLCSDGVRGRRDLYRSILGNKRHQQEEWFIDKNKRTKQETMQTQQKEERRRVENRSGKEKKAKKKQA